MRKIVFLMGFISLLICMPAAAGDDIAVEDLSEATDDMDKDMGASPANIAIDRSADSDADGIPDVRDICPDSPRVTGTYDVGELFSLEDVEFRYMGISDDGVRIIQTTNVAPEEGGNQQCLLAPAAVNKKPVTCLISGSPEIEIVLIGEMGSKIRLLIRHRVDDKGCPSQM